MSKIIFEDRTKGEENKEEVDGFSAEKIEKCVKALAGTISLTAINTGYYYYLKPDEVVLGLLTSMEDLIAIYSKELCFFNEFLPIKIVNSVQNINSIIELKQIHKDFISAIIPLTSIIFLIFHHSFY